MLKVKDSYVKNSCCCRKWSRSSVGRQCTSVASITSAGTDIKFYAKILLDVIQIIKDLKFNKYLWSEKAYKLQKTLVKDPCIWGIG